MKFLGFATNFLLPALVVSQTCPPTPAVGQNCSAVDEGTVYCGADCESLVSCHDLKKQYEEDLTLV